MPNKEASMWKTVDWMTIGLYIVMVVAGWISVCGASYNIDQPTLFDWSGRTGLQFVWIMSSIVLIFLIMMLDKNFFETFAYPIYGFVILILILTIFIAPNIKGSHSWIVITPSIRFQPAEFAKFATALALARLMSTYEFNLLNVKNFILSLLIILLPMLCIIFQHDTGSALMFLALALVLYREGMSGYVLLLSLLSVFFFVIELKYKSVEWNNSPVSELITSLITLAIMCFMLRFVMDERKLSYYFTGIVLLAAAAGYLLSLFVPLNLVWISSGLIVCLAIYLIFYAFRSLLWKFALLALFACLSMAFTFSVDYVFNDVLKPHQQQRIRVTLSLDDDPKGAGYNVNQSKIAIGSGGFSGKGFLNGTQTKLKYVPEQDTDFIFCTVGEEFGFLGSLFVLLTYGVFLVRLIYLSERQSSVFARVYGYSVFSIFFIHVIINIGMVSGIMPVIGVPLPFFSYGGSSLWGFTILLFIFLRFDAARKEQN